MAQNQVQLVGGGLPRNSGESALPSFYPPNLTIIAGAGGVLLGNAVTLFPSPTGQFDLTTTEGGDFRSRDPGKLYNFTVSDSAAKQYTFVNGQFGPSDHASVPLHLADREPARVLVSGSLEEIVLSFPKSAKVQVGGDLVNAGLLTQNLPRNDVTRLEVAGDIRNRNDYTFVTLPPGVLPPDLELQNLAEPALPISLFYDAATRQIGFRGRMSEDALAALLALQIRVIDGVGNPTFNTDGTLITVAAQLIPAAVAQELFTKSGDVPQRPPVGYQVGGGGQFEVRARNLDLGVTAGILSIGSAANAALGSLGQKGADLNIRVEKDLVMFSSAIISKAGGALHVEAGHEIQAGSSLVLPVSDGARGIYSSAGSDVTVQAGGNILLNGSRIAAYDGGNVTVRSTSGNVDAGSGGLSLQAVEQVRVNPNTSETSIKTDFIPGSGILATTFASGNAQVGDILVVAPRGDILARAGGVVQAPLNGTANTSGKVQLTAGTKPSDGETGFIGRIDASKSGVIGGNVSLDATGPIIGVVFASGNINIATPQAVNVTALAQGGVNVAAGGSISGTLVGVGSVTATGSSVDAALVSQNVSGSPGATAAVTASVATAAAQSASAQATQNTPATKPTTDEADEEARRLASRKPVLVRTVGRVQVLLPDSSRSN